MSLLLVDSFESVESLDSIRSVKSVKAVTRFTISTHLSQILSNANVIERGKVELTNIELHLYLVSFIDFTDAWQDRCQKLIHLTNQCCTLLGLSSMHHRSTIYFSSFFTLIKRLHCGMNENERKDGDENGTMYKPMGFSFPKDEFFLY